MKLLSRLQKRVLPGVSDRGLLRVRYIGSMLLILSHFIILYISVPVGVTVMLLSDFICLPYAIRKGYWDITAVIGVYSIINIVRLLTL
jgi:hypothetical protein